MGAADDSKVSDVESPQGPRGAALLLAHVALLDEVAPERAPASVRLEQALGSELAQFLQGAFALGRGQRRSRRLVA